MQDYKPNSNRFKEEERANSVEKKKVEKIISGTAKTKKKSQASKFADIFISEDASNVKSYIFMDVLVPAIKKAISDIVTDGIDMILYGGTHNNKNRSSNPTNYVSYRSYSDKDSKNDRFSDSSRSRSSYNFDNVELSSRGECERVLSVMGDLIDTFGMVSVGDMYEMVGITPRFTDYDYGWKFIGDAKVERTRYGYLLVMPKISPLK